MGYILYPIRDILEASFTILPELGNSMNYFLMAVGAVAGTIWIGLMVKYEKKEVANR